MNGTGAIGRSGAARWRCARSRLLAASIAAVSMAGGSGAAAQGPAAGEPIYLSRPGDHLTAIARLFLVDGASPDNLRQLRQLNRLRDPDRIAAGTPLRLPLGRLRMEAAIARLIRATAASRRDGTPLTAGMALRAGEELSTVDNGEALLELADGTRLWLRDGSRLSIDTLRAAPALGHSEATFTLHGGRVESRVHKLRDGSRFEIRSPVATLGVRGTAFRGSYDGRDTRLEVIEGRVGLAGTDAATAVAVDAGYGARVDRDGRTEAPQRLLDAPALDTLPTRIETPLLRFVWPAQAGASAWRGEVIDPRTRQALASQRSPNPELRFAGLADGDYELVARAISADGLEGLDARHAFALRARPEPPFLRRTSAGRVYGDHLALAWTEAPAAQRYRLQIDRQAGFEAPELDQVVELPGSSAPLPPGDYLWRVASIDTQGRQGPYSPAERVTLRPMPAQAPSAQAGADGLELAWPGEPEQRFRVEIGRDENFADLLLSTTTATPSLRLALPPPGVYRIRIGAIEADGELAPFAPARRFEVPEPPPPPAWLRWLPMALPLLMWLL